MSDTFKLPEGLSFEEETLPDQTIKEDIPLVPEEAKPVEAIPEK